MDSMTSVGAFSETRSADNLNDSLKTKKKEVKSELNITSFDVDKKGKPLSSRKLRGLSRCEWIAFNLKCTATTIRRTFKWIGSLISIIREKGDLVEKIQSFRLMGGVIAKLMQSIGSNDALIRSIFSPNNDEEFEKIKTELKKTMSDNAGMSISKIIKLLDKSGISYDKNRADEIEILGAGTIASVVSVPMEDGSVKAIKMVDKSLEMLFLSDISIIGKFLGLISIFKPKILGAGSKKGIMMFMETMPKEFDMRYEAASTIIQKGVTERIEKDENRFNIKEENDCPCDADMHGASSRECTRCLRGEPPKPQTSHKLAVLCLGNDYTTDIEIKYKVPTIDIKQSTRDMLVMEKINGVPLSATTEEIADKISYQVSKAFGRENDYDNNKDTLKDDVEIVGLVCKAGAFQIWEKGLYNEGNCSADLHYGNIMVAVDIESKALEVYNIDFGNYFSLSKDSVISLYAFGSAIETICSNVYSKTPDPDHSKDIKVLKSALAKVGVAEKKDADIGWVAIENEIINLIKDIDMSEDTSREDAELTFMMKIFDISFNHGLIMPAYIIGLLRAKIIS